jgi:TrmH family RNA methyltransferase
MISSAKNTKIQRVRLLQNQARARREQRAFVIEGVRLAEEALASGWEAQLVLHTEELSERGLKVLARYSSRGALVEAVSPHVMASISDTQTPQGLLVVLSLQSLPLPASLDLLLIPDGVRDPGNLGAMLRTAAAAAVQAVFLPPETVDPFAPKVLRAAMGAHFRLPILPLDWQALGNQLRHSALHVFLAEPGAHLGYTRADFRQPLALVIGSEASGASIAAQGCAQTSVKIPMPGGTESLNAAVAAGILLFEVVRQRSG